MFELLMQMIPEWIAKFRSPMNEGERRGWEKLRKRGMKFYLLLWAFGMGGLLVAINIWWNLYFEK